MFTKEDILARLQKGEDAQTIANEMAKVLNDATTEYSAKEKLQKAKEKAAADMINAINGYMALEPEKNKDYMEAINQLEPAQQVKAIMDAFDSITFSIKAFNDMDKMIKTNSKSDLAKGFLSDEQKIFDFLRTLGV